MLDVRQPGASDIIGDRALGAEPMQVAALGRAMLDGLASAGALGVIKHIPGHGRALVDSHQELPVVTASEEELAIDLEPFERLREAPMGMTATFLYTAWDPERPAAQSPFVIGEIIRQRIGFDGFLMSDDIGMEALAGDYGAARRGLRRRRLRRRAALRRQDGEDASVAGAVGDISAEGEARLARAMAMRFTPDDEMDFAEAVAKRDALLALV